MSIYSNFERKERDFYPTPKEAVFPLLPFLNEYKTFAEPCAGDGRLVNHIEEMTDLKCSWKSDIHPLDDDIQEADALFITEPLKECDVIITNPPWDRNLLHPMIEHFSLQNETWLLFDANWMHTKQAVPHMKYCSKIVSVGRVKWFGGMSGTMDCCWYQFMYRKNFNDFCDTLFYLER